MVTTTDAILAEQNVFAEPSQAIIIPSEYALDVDGPEDLVLAEWYLESGKVRL